MFQGRSPGGHKQVKPKQVQSKAEKYKDMGMGKEFRSDYQVPTTKPSAGIGHQVPAGYTRQSSTGSRPEQLSVRHQMATDQTQQLVGQTNIPDYIPNHTENQMNGPYSVHPQYQDQQDPNYNAQMHYQASQRMQPAQHQSPRDRRQSQKTGNIASPSRPNVAPPPPPPMDQGYIQRSDRASMSPQRDSLPPPPPPPLENGYVGTPQMRNPQLQNVMYPGGSPRDSDLPPPPPLPVSPDLAMPPPPSPPPILQHSTPPPPPPLQQAHTQPAPPPPPPPPPAPMAPPLLNGQADTVSVSSENSTYSSTASGREVDVPPEPPKMTARNALLDEIRLGDCKYFLPSEFYINTQKL